MTWAIKRRNGGIDGNDALMDDVSLWEPTDDYGNGPWIEIVPAEQIKKLEARIEDLEDALMLVYNCNDVPLNIKLLAEIAYTKH